MELNAYFQSLKAYSESKQARSSGSFDLSGTLFDLTRKNNLGSVITRPIPDSKGVPMKIMTNLYEIHETNYQMDENGQLVLDDKGQPIPQYSTIIIADPCNYTSSKMTLTMDQIALLNKALEACATYKQYTDDEIIDSTETPTNLWIKKCKEITLFYGKVLSVINDSGSQDDGTTRCLVHKSAKFYTDMCSAMDSTTAARRDGGAWLSQYFNRDVGSGTRLVSITTALNKPGTVGYSNTISFTEGAEYSITDKDISVADDIDANPYCDITTFNSDVISAALNRLTSYIAKADAAWAASTGFVAAPQPQSSTIDNLPKVADGFVAPGTLTQQVNPPIPSEFAQASPTAASVPPVPPTPQVNQPPVPPVPHASWGHTRSHPEHDG